MVNFFVLAFLFNDDNVLLARRIGASFGNGLYSLVGGKVEQGETALHAIAREIREEIALEIPESAFNLVHTFHRKGTETELIALCFQADISTMVPRNNEPNEHDDLRFFNVNQLPENIISAHKQAIECIQKNIYYSEHGWK